MLRKSQGLALVDAVDGFHLGAVQRQFPWRQVGRRARCHADVRDTGPSIAPSALAGLLAEPGHLQVAHGFLRRSTEAPADLGAGGGTH